MNYFHLCARGLEKDLIDFNSLPSSVATYLNSNYSGYTFNKAFIIKDNSGNVQGYVVIIQYNGNPVGLKFEISYNQKLSINLNLNLSIQSMVKMVLCEY